MVSEIRTYRNPVTGLIDHLHPRVAKAAGNLIEVDTDAKPLAYTPIPPEAIAKLTSALHEDTVEGEPVDENDEETA